MRSTFFSLLFITSMVICLCSCKNAVVKELTIPKDAEMAVHIDGNSLFSKVDWKEVQQSEWFIKQLRMAKDSSEQKLLQDPEASGIELKSDFLFFSKKERTGRYSAFQGKIKDLKAFEALVQKQNGEKKIEEEKNFRFVKTGMADLITWNDFKFIFVSNAPSKEAPGQNLSFDTLKKIVNDLYGLKRDNSIVTDSVYVTLLKEEGDIHLWTRSGSTLELAAPLSQLASSRAMRDAAVTSTITFENGKISIRSTQYLPPEMEKLMPKQSAQRVSAEQVNNLPFSDVAALGIINYPPGSFTQFLTGTGLNYTVDAFLKKSGLSLDQVNKSLSGQMLFAITDPVPVNASTIQNPGIANMFPVPVQANAFAALSLSDTASINRLLTLAKKGLEEEGEAEFPFQYKVSKDWFVLSTSTQTADRFLAGGRSTQPFAARITGHPVGLFIDAQKFMNAVQLPSDADSSDVAAILAAKKLWQDVVVTGGDYENGVISFVTVINLVNTQSNSLKQLAQFGMLMASLKKEDDDAFEDTPSFTRPAQPTR